MTHLPPPYTPHVPPLARIGLRVRVHLPSGDVRTGVIRGMNVTDGVLVELDGPAPARVWCQLGQLEGIG